MASFVPSYKGGNDFNKGEKYRNNIDSPSATDFNNVIENLLVLNKDLNVFHDETDARLLSAEANINSFEGKLDEISETIEQDISETQKKVENLYARTFPEIDVIDSSVAYQRIVPIGALPYAEVAKVGGMSYKTKNLIPFPYVDGGSGTVKKVNGITYTVNADGSVHAEGTATAGARFALANSVDFGTENAYASPHLGAVSKSGYTFYNVHYQPNVGAYLYVNSGDTIDVTYHPMVNEGSTALPYSPYFEGLRHAKVTEIRSSGKNHAVSTDSSTSSERGIEITRNIGKSSAVLNGTSTAESATRLFGNFKLPVGTYTASVLGLNSTDRLYVGKTADGGVVVNYIQTNSPKTFTLTEETECFLQVVWGSGSVYKNTEIKVQIERGNTATEYKPYTESFLLIPSAVQALPDYGLGVDAEYNNHIDWVEKKYHKDVGRYVFDGTENWSLSTHQPIEGYSRFDVSISKTGIGAKAERCVCNKYAYNGSNKAGVWFNNSSPDKIEFRIMTNEFSNSRELTTALAQWYAEGNPLIAVYPLAVPTETDISDLLPDDNFIRVEGGGTITAVNEYGLAAPITINYQVD